MKDVDYYEGRGLPLTGIGAPADPDIQASNQKIRNALYEEFLLDAKERYWKPGYPDQAWEILITQYRKIFLEEIGYTYLYDSFLEYIEDDMRLLDMVYQAGLNDNN